MQRGRKSGAVEPSSMMALEYFKQFLDQLTGVGGGNPGVHAGAELHQADGPLVVHREADDALQGRCPGVVNGELDVSGNMSAFIRSRSLQLPPSPEESTSSCPEPP